MTNAPRGINYVVHQANAGVEDREINAETAPLRDPQYYRFDIDVADVADVWRRGSVVSSWLLEKQFGGHAELPRAEAA